MDDGRIEGRFVWARVGDVEVSCAGDGEMFLALLAEVRGRYFHPYGHCLPVSMPGLGSRVPGVLLV